MEKNSCSILPDRIITPFEILTATAISFQASGDFQLEKIHREDRKQENPKKIIRAEIALPGFIDMHVHGGYGVSFGIGDIQRGLEKYSAWAASKGVTGFVLSITGPDESTILSTILNYVKILEKSIGWPGAIPLGLHLEGPFLNPEKHGAFNKAWIHHPSLDEMKKYIDTGRGWIRHVSMAPELENADEVARFLDNSGVKVSLGHSNTDYETAAKALRGPYRHVTHTFNAQSSLHHREPGVVGAVLSSDKITAELIGDAFHVHPAAMKILYRCLGSERIVLITDAMPGAGLPDGEYELLAQKITVKSGKATLPDGTLGGSTVTMDSALRTLVNLADMPLEDAARMSTYNPARVIGMEHRMGSVETGKEGNLTLLNHDLLVQKTFVNGRLVYSGKGK